MTEMPDAKDALSPPPGSTPSEMFPVLTSAQQARVLAHGQRRTVEQSEIVVERNEQVAKFFGPSSGRRQILQVSNNQEHVVAICKPGMFTGEHARIANGDDVLLIVRDLQDLQLSADHYEEFRYMLIEFDNDLTLLDSAMLAMCEDASLLAGS